MKITYRQLLSSIDAFRELQEIKFPPRTSLDIYKLGKELDRELDTYRELSRKIYKSYDIPETDEGAFDLKSMDKKSFEPVAKDLEELLDAEAELKSTEIPIDIFERFNLPLSASMLIALDWLIKIDEEKAEEKPSKSKDKKGTE